MVDDTSTWHQHRRRRRKNTSYYPSAALLASLAAFVTPAVLARPVLLPFLYPSIPQSTSTSSSPRQQQQHSSPSRPRQKRSATPSSSTSSDRQPTATASQPAASEGRRADRLANHFQPDDAGHFKPACWSLHGQSNCPRDDHANGAIDDDPDVHEVVPGQPDFTPTSSTSGPSASVTPPTPTTTTSPTSTSTSTAAPSATTVEPYTMTFNVSNIPPGWQKNARTSFYSKNLIIGFSVTLAALICLTIVLCVIWRIRVARGRRESERALKEKKKELGLASQTSDDSSSLDHDQDRESTRQRGLRRRRVNVRAGDEDDDDDDNDDGDDGQREGAAMSEKNGMTPSGRKRRTAFMRTFSGKMLTGPTKWRRNRKRRQQEQEEEEEEEEDRTRAEVEEDGERQEQSGRRDTTATSIPPPLETQTSFSALLAQSSTSTAVEAPIPLSPPPPPPVSLQPPSTTAPLRNGGDEEDDDVDPTSVQPPAYRRRNFGIRSRAAPAPTTAAPMSARALEKQREAGDVPEEYMYMAGMMPPPLPSSTVVANDASLVLERSRSVGLPPVEQDRDEDDEEDGEEEAPRREDVSAHLATDDKTVLARLHQSGSAPSAPPAELDALEEGGSHVLPVVPEEVEMYDLEDAQGSASGSSYLSPPTTTTTSSSFLPAPPAITSAHLFVPPPPPQSTEHEDGSELPRYVAGPSAPSFAGRSEKLSTPGPSEPPVPLPSAPPAEPDQAASTAGLIVPSAPPMVEDGEVQEFALVPSAPPLLEDEALGDDGAGPSAPK